MDDEKYRLKNPDVNFNVVSLQDLDYSRIAIYKIAYVNTPEETEKLKARLPQYIFEKYEISSSVPQFVEIVNKGVTKAVNNPSRFLHARLQLIKHISDYHTLSFIVQIVYFTFTKCSFYNYKMFIFRCKGTTKNAHTQAKRAFFFEK